MKSEEEGVSHHTTILKNPGKGEMKGFMLEFQTYLAYKKGHKKDKNPTKTLKKPLQSHHATNFSPDYTKCNITEWHLVCSPNRLKPTCKVCEQSPVVAQYSQSDTLQARRVGESKRRERGKASTKNKDNSQHGAKAKECKHPAQNTELWVTDYALHKRESEC